MLISLDWIKEFVTLPELSAKELGEKFTLATAEVEGVKLLNESFSKIRVAEIVKIEPHPDADKLNLVSFMCGEDAPKQVVCGASNVRVGLKTPFAPIGVTLPNGLTLEPRKIRGVLSEGMLCSESELDLATDSSGIMELSSDAPVGVSFDEFFGLKVDTILDVDNKSLTHRPDLWGHYGLAREFSAIFRNKLSNPFDEKWFENIDTKINDCSQKQPEITIQVEKSSAAKAYFGITLDGVKVGESPKWMQSRLLAAGLRPINSIVDISNYVMLELGIPNHIFDREQIAGNKVFIKELSASEKFTTLDEEQRDLVIGDTVICDQDKTLVIAGLMGGLNSGVSGKTNKIFIEVANWIPSRVRKTSTRLGLRTDSSQRYEKSLDSKLCKRTLYRLIDLILQLNPSAKIQGPIAYDGDDLAQVHALKIQLDCDRVRKVLGHEISDKEIVDILNSLDMKVSGQGILNIEVPSYRATKDIEYAVDLIEEVGRIIGYDNIAKVSPKLNIAPVELPPTGLLHRKIADFLVQHGSYLELQTYPMIGDDLLKKAKWEEPNSLRLVNALSQDAEIMRPSIIPSLLEVAAKNVKHFEQFRAFEIGRVYAPGKGSFSNEQTQIAVCLYHAKESVFLELCNQLERLFLATNLPAQLVQKHPKFKSEVLDESWKGVHPHEFFNIRLMGKMKGSAFSVHPWLLREFKIKGNFAIAVLNLGGVEERAIKEKIKYSPLERFPKSSFDWTVVASKDEPVGNILAPLTKLKIKFLQETKIVGTFNIDENTKSVTLKATFSDPNSTLDGEFLSQARDQLVATMDKAGYPLKQ